jgi:hypothetical protein
VFSILFNKPFIVYGNSERGKARFESLLQCFGLKNRYVDETMGNLSQVLNSAINWNKVNHILDEKRGEAFSFLRTNL